MSEIRLPRIPADDYEYEESLPHRYARELGDALEYQLKHPLGTVADAVVLGSAPAARFGKLVLPEIVTGIGADVAEDLAGVRDAFYTGDENLNKLGELIAHHPTDLLRIPHGAYLDIIDTWKQMPSKIKDWLELKPFQDNDQ